MTTYAIGRGFGRKRIKEYFVVQADGDTLSGVVAGPFQTEEQSVIARDALTPLYTRRLTIVGGHLISHPYVPLR